MELKNLQYAMRIGGVFNHLKERDGLTFNLSAVRVLLAIRFNPISHTSTINTIGERLGTVNNRSQINGNLRKLIECEMVYCEVVVKTNHYGVTIRGFNLLTELDSKLRRLKLKKLTKKNRTYPIPTPPVPLER